MPDAVAIACPGRSEVAGDNMYDACSFAQLHDDATAVARGLVELGVQPGDRLALLVRPGIEFVELVFGLLRSGATAVLIDPGMGRRQLLDSLAAINPDGFVAISPAHAMRSLIGGRFPAARFNVTVGRRWFWGGKTLVQLLRQGRKSQASLPTTLADDPAAIIFTSGSTGPPKGVLYTHQMFDTQVAEIGRRYDIHPGTIDLACFALFGLFNSALGVTTVFPKIDFSRPAAAKPVNLLAAARDWQVTQAFASPAVWDNLSHYCLQHDERIPTLHKIFSCGAPVPADVLRQTLACVRSDAQMHTPYGATECLPVATIEAGEVLSETALLTEQGAGVCVGSKFGSIDWKVIRITDKPIPSIAETEELPNGEIGELIVRGPQASPEYVTLDASGNASQSPSDINSNSLAKIADGNSFWHRLGDVGTLDQTQRFWYCGRKAHRVELGDGRLFTIPTEAVFNAHPRVRRSALVGVGERDCQTPVLVVELQPESDEVHKKRPEARWPQIESELRELGQKSETLRQITHFLRHPNLPVDVRHNAKINRELLAHWAAQQLPRRSGQPPTSGS